MISKEILTTGDAAKLCGVTVKTIIRWIDQGKLNAFKLPGRGDHRILRNEMIDFLKVNNIPFNQVQQADPDNSESAQLTKGNIANSQPRALIIDDEELMALTIARTLKREKIDVKTSNNAFEAGVWLERFKPHIITLDINMPGINGFQILKGVQELSTSQGLGIIIITGIPLREIQEKINFSDSQHFQSEILEKPFSAEDLINITKKLLNKFYQGASHD
ncbi:response regulator [Piscirickettsia litoralis]|uniref:Response regulatory domain-containing protein n=1 Tax=Piscirickettsia litoralis TaxID=1891921 RepID=A0ABX2ZZ88_9GAMM|nr:response regulator [Piscirickettsia litoralis]ODN41937.1 hypothetical protein BGC07_01865 [Piscirickettsia litoralis]